MQEHHAYLSLMLELRDTTLDVVHNNSLHYLPVAMAASLRGPGRDDAAHPADALARVGDPGARPLPGRRSPPSAGTPPTPGATSSPTRRSSTTASTSTAGAQGPGGGPAVWSGRLVPEKGPHLAAQAAARAGVPLRLAGPVMDQAWFDAQVRPWLGRRHRATSATCAPTSW